MKSGVPRDPVKGKKLATPVAPRGVPGSHGAPLGPPGGWESEFFEKRKAHAKYGAEWLELSRFQVHFWSNMDGSDNADMHISLVFSRFP